MKSLVITIYYSVVNYMSNFAHTAHHARKIILSGKYNGYALYFVLLRVLIRVGMNLLLRLIIVI
jgi:hypothetical protein